MLNELRTAIVLNGASQWFKQALEKIYIPQFLKGGDDSGDGGNGVLKINFDRTVETVANIPNSGLADP